MLIKNEREQIQEQKQSRDSEERESLSCYGSD